MTDAELIARLRNEHVSASRTEAADLIEALIAENKRLGQQCEGLMQAGMNNGQALIIAENKLAKAVKLIDLAVELARWDLNPKLRDDMIDFTTELKG